MKRTLTSILLLALCFACSPRQEQLRSGDLVFVGIPLDYSIAEDSMSQAISESTGKGELNLIHVAIADVDKDGTYIIDATLKRGVDRHPLDSFLTDFTLKDGSLPVFVVKRLKKGITAPECIKNAISFCGEPYDTVFREGNGAHYCSELVRDSYLTPDGQYIFEQTPMNWKDSNGEIPVYWTQLFGMMGMEVPQGEPGTNPQEMAMSPALESVNVTLTSCR